MKVRINHIVLFLFLAICMFFPGDPYNLKLAALAVLLIINAGDIIEKIGCAQYRVVLYFGFMFPIATMIQSSLLTSNIGAAISGAYSMVILLLLIPIVEQDIDYKRQVLILLKTMAVVTLLIAFADIIGVFNVNGPNFIRNSFYAYGMGLMGKSPAYSSYYRIFFKASPLLVILLDDAISRRDIKWMILSFGALWFSGTRANVFSALIIFFFRYMVWNTGGITKIKKLLMATAMLAVVVLSFSRIYSGIAGQMNTSGAVASDLVRQGEIQSYLEVFSNPVRLLFGYGFGSAFYNYGRASLDLTSELSYFEMIRCVGLVFAVPFFGFVLYPIISSAVKPEYKLSYICYLIIAATNPLLFSSTAMVMYIFLYQDIVTPGRHHSVDALMQTEMVFHGVRGAAGSVNEGKSFG